MENMGWWGRYGYLSTFRCDAPGKRSNAQEAEVGVILWGGGGYGYLSTFRCDAPGKRSNAEEAEVGVILWCGGVDTVIYQRFGAMHRVNAVMQKRQRLV